MTDTTFTLTVQFRQRWMEYDCLGCGPSDKYVVDWETVAGEPPVNVTGTMVCAGCGDEIGAVRLSWTDVTPVFKVTG